MIWYLLALAAFALVLVACGPAQSSATPVPCPTAAPCPECPAPPECPKPAVEQIPYADRWAGSPHADAKAAAFTHWDEETPKEIPVGCAKCHSTPGFLDYIGADGSAQNIVDKPAPTGTVINCEACHNDTTAQMTSVLFPSGVEVADLGPEARCMQCHQGRTFGGSVDEAVTKAGLTDEDTPSDQLGFTNIHYRAAAATMYGTVTKGGYEYPDKAYDVKFGHVQGLDTCIDCHDQHSLRIKYDVCANCHPGVAKEEDLFNIRMQGSEVDYDGDGNTTEGIAAEVDGLRVLLLQNIQAYANDVTKSPIAYNADAYPYFFADANNNGAVDEGETKFAAWTGRLLKAAYNYQLSVKDPGAFAHGGKYVIELLYDSIENLNEKVSAPIDLTKLHRIDAGHFAGSEMAFRDWDSEGMVPGSCAKCHGAGGLPMFLKEGTTISVPTQNGMLCANCHDMANFPNRYEVTGVKFPSGATVDSGNPDANLCMTCHQGRESTVSMNNAVKGLDPDTPSNTIRFRNVHYFAAGATRYGTEVQGGYEYEGQTYVGLFQHVPGFQFCTECHDTHTQAVKFESCVCHNVKTEEDLKKIRMATTDFDGDGNTTEGIADEITTYQERLLTAIQDYAQNVAGAPISYEAQTYPYFLGADGKAYAAWTPRLLEAAYNYQFSIKDPGAFAHNAKYIIQVLHDSLADLGKKVTVDMTGLTRP